MEPTIAKSQRAWEKSLARQPTWIGPASGRLAVHLPLNGDLRGEIHPDPPKSEKYAYLMENGPVGGGISAYRDRASVEKRATRNMCEGRSGRAGSFDGKRFIEVGNVANFGFYDSFTLAAWIYPTAAHGSDRQPRPG